MTKKNEKFADFCETSTAYSSWYAEFRTFRIFEISLSVPMIFEMFFPFPVFLTVRAYLKTYFYEDYSVYSTFCGKLDPLEFLSYILPFRRYRWKHLIFFNSVTTVFLATFRLFHVQNVEDWPLMKINQFCFCFRKLRCIQ